MDPANTSTNSELHQFGKIVQRNLAPVLHGYKAHNDANELKEEIWTMENVNVDKKCAQFGFNSFRDLLESKLMAKFVNVIKEWTADGAEMVTYLAVEDETTRGVIGAQRVYDKYKREKEARRQYFAARQQQNIPPRSLYPHLPSVPPSAIHSPQSAQIPIESAHEVQRDYQRFLSDYRGLMQWVDRMIQLVSSGGLANNATEAEALLERHQDYRREIDARTSTFHAFDQFGNRLINSGHFAADDLRQCMQDVKEARCRLEDAWVERQKILVQWEEKEEIRTLFLSGFPSTTHAEMDASFFKHYAGYVGAMLRTRRTGFQEAHLLFATRKDAENAMRLLRLQRLCVVFALQNTKIDRLPIVHHPQHLPQQQQQPLPPTPLRLLQPLPSTSLPLQQPQPLLAPSLPLQQPQSLPGTSGGDSMGVAEVDQKWRLESEPLRSELARLANVFGLRLVERKQSGSFVLMNPAEGQNYIILSDDGGQSSHVEVAEYRDCEQTSVEQWKKGSVKQFVLTAQGKCLEFFRQYRL